MTQLVVPHWIARMIKEKHGSLEAYSEKMGVRVTDDYWDQLSLESQARINERLIRGWKRA